MATRSPNGRTTSETMRSLIIGSSLGALAVIGTPTVTLAQSSAEEACAAVLALRSPSAVEYVIETYAEHPCVPRMLAALPVRVLTRIDPRIVAELPRSQLRLIPRTVLQQLGINPRLGGSGRSIGDRPQTTNSSQY